MTTDPRGQLAALAATRHGVISVADAAAVGLSRSRLRTDIERGLWRRPCRGVLVAAAAPRSWRQDLAIATVSTSGVASHRSAARLHGLDGYTHDVVEVSVRRPDRRRRSSWIVHQSGSLAPCDCIVIDGIRCTGLARTLVDLGAVVSDDLVEQALDDARRRGASARWIDDTLTRLHRPGPSGTGALLRVLDRPDQQGPLPGSVFERLMERTMIDAGLPPPERQHRVHDDHGRLVAVLDHAWPGWCVGAEAQSERWHGGPRGAQRDLDRHNRLTALGWRMVYATWKDAREPTGFVRRLAELLDAATGPR